MYTLPTKPEPIGVVLDDAIELYRYSFRSCWMISLLGTAINLAVRLRVGSTMPNVTFRGRDVQQTITDIAAAFQHQQSSLLNSLLLLLLNLIIYGALFAAIHSAATSERKVSALEALVTTLRRLPGLIVAAVVWTVAVLVGLVLFAIPGIYLWGKLEFWLAAALVDDVGGIGGLGRSWEVTQGNWWRSVTALTVAFVLVVVVASVAGLVSALAIAMAHSDLTTVLLITQLFSGLAEVFTLPMVPAAMLAIYYDMKLRRDGGDLLARANSLQTA